MTIRFCVLATPRTGSNWLCSALHSHPQIVCHNELFHKKEMFFAEDGGKIDGAAGAIWFRLRHIFPQKFLDVLQNQASTATAFGFKLFPEHGKRKVRIIAGNPDCRIIFLTRLNRLAQYSSFVIAQQSGEWINRDGPKPDKAAKPKARFDREAYLAYAQRQEASDHWVHDQLAGRDYLALDYDELGSRMPEAFTFLGLEAPAGELGDTTKQNSANLLDRFVNPDDVRAALDAAGQGHFLD